MHSGKVTLGYTLLKKDSHYLPTVNFVLYDTKQLNVLVNYFLMDILSWNTAEIITDYDLTSVIKASANYEPGRFKSKEALEGRFSNVFNYHKGLYLGCPALARKYYFSRMDSFRTLQIDNLYVVETSRNIYDDL
jgi:hypothetical protein